jgi:hypothetical protein
MNKSIIYKIIDIPSNKLFISLAAIPKVVNEIRWRVPSF